MPCRRLSFRLLAILVLPLACATGCRDEARNVYTLYRSDVQGSLRIHVATFDAYMTSVDGKSSGEDYYNGENCRTAMDLFQQQPGVRVRYWCEKGRFNP